jgi:lysophospholipase L1-like esterase
MRRVLVLVLLICAPAAMAQDAGPRLEALGSEAGWIGVAVTGEPGSTVALHEGATAYGTVTLDAAGRFEQPRLTAWRCDVRERDIVATDGAQRSTTLRISTPSCADRLGVRLRPRYPRAGRPFTVELRDRWGHGDLRPRVCAAGPAVRGCARPRFQDERAAFRYTPRRAGRWRISVDGRRRAVAQVVPGRGPLKLLAAGDSMIQYVDTALGARLPRARVRSDDHIATGVSKPAMLNWMRQAERTSRSFGPDATVVFLGANDGFPIAGAECCDDAWVEGYAGRVRRMMRAYARGGRGAVYWLLLPVPRKPEFKPIYRAVNRAIRLAARRYPGLVRVVDTEAFFTPSGYRDSVRWRGRTVTVRQADGVHLNQAGAAIAAQLVIRAMRRDGVIR